MTAQITAQCTPECVIVPCSDDAPVCDGVCPGNHCDLVCEDASNCKDCTGFENFLECCTDFHSYYEEPRNHPETSTTWSWDPALKSFVCSCGGGSQVDCIPPGGTALTNNFPAMEDSASAVSTSQQSTPSPHPLPAALELELSVLTCMWGGCKAAFDNLEDLATHVNLAHLGHRPHPCQQPPRQQPPVPSPLTASDFAMSCQWKDCSIYPTPNSVPGPSSGDIDSMLCLLSSHLLHDHLGLEGAPHCHNTNPSDLHLCQNPQLHAGLFADELEATISTLPPPEAEDTASGGQICQWSSCGQSFASLDDLTVHLTNIHVGSGKTAYDCHWKDCPRHEENGFSSKQKLCRHLQSHTGHRPFQCKVCLQNFSEAATLQQHMRRHTQEKPYLCDYPGCGKSFAITGALTIHKRTHNGQKPFKCPHCEKAFSESSNLSKHLRTHTGAKPYTCEKCNKSFARADQLTRHARVHNKNPPDT
ncbi:hypothetical protein C8F04DRAFT_1207375 [Mycena alexandri]|uniref:C2H2-type domain-containing protein n=1 Tax=Mycena alexandri TaxID=1745969 RepID=A0AAD6TBG5_9AGAR|nr:hypothetical protein C8F04DRAFT_1207375 [Mycena alexandri]